MKRKQVWIKRFHSFKNKKINTAIDTWGSLLWETELAAFKTWFCGRNAYFCTELKRSLDALGRDYEPLW